VGVTGAPGAGKSTLTDGLISGLRQQGDGVGVLAVDPTSPFTGGAVLGDRVRMQDHVSDPAVYIRSMASRGHLGGLSAAAPKALAVLDAVGFPWLLIETVGVGQDEVEIVEAADTTIVVITPGWGDGIQAAKAGILEIGDLFVVNKADRHGVEDTVADLRTMLQMGGERAWEPPILPTIAATGEGIGEVLAAIGEHRAHLTESGGLEAGRRLRRRSELESALAVAFRHMAETATQRSDGDVVAAVEAGDLDPWTAADQMLGSVGWG
jgi:LAO/AO transport system kinase